MEGRREISSPNLHAFNRLTRNVTRKDVVQSSTISYRLRPASSAVCLKNKSKCQRWHRRCRVLIFLASRLSKTFADKHPAVPRMFAGNTFGAEAAFLVSFIPVGVSGFQLSARMPNKNQYHWAIGPTELSNS